MNKMVNFKLGNEMWKVTDQHDTSMEQRINLSHRRQESNPWPPEHRGEGGGALISYENSRHVDQFIIPLLTQLNTILDLTGGLSPSSFRMALK